jgi:hypothetical protein
MLKKPIQCQVLGDVAKGGGYFISLGESDSAPCAVCQHRMLYKDIIDGKFDPTPTAMGATPAILIAILVGAAFLVYQCSK